MSDKIPKSVFASLPRTTRGTPIVLGGDPKGKNFLYTNNNSVIIRDISDPGVADVYTQHSCNAISAKYSPSGFYIASGDVSGKIRIWDTVNREHILKNEFQPLGGTIKDIGWSGDSQRIAVCGEGREKFAHVFSMDTGTSVGDLIGIGKACNSISFKEQRPFKIVVGCEDKSASFFEGPPFKFKLSLTDHTNFVNVVRYSPDGSIFVTGGADGKALIYDGKTAESIGNLGDPAHKGGIYSLCFSPEGSQVLTVSGDKTAKIWNVASKELVLTFEIGKTVDDMLVGCLWQGENIIAVALSGYIYYLNKNDPSTPLRIIKGHNKPVTALSLSEDRSTLYTADQMGRIVLWNAASGDNDVIEGKGHSGQVQDMIVSDGNLISVAMDDTIRFTNLSQNQYGDNSTKLDSMPRAVAAESGLVAIACINHIIVFRNGTKLLSQGVNFEPVSIDILKGSSLIAVGGEKDHKVHFYDVSSGGLSEVHVLNNEAAAMDVKFSPDGQYVATGGADKYVRCYSVSNYENLFSYPQRLTGEYAKLKAQIPVLKKAYIDEQAACNELKEQLKEKEQAVRKFEQEIDSLSFRNQQLSKRVLILQDELDETQSHRKKGKNKHSEGNYQSPPISTGVFNEELHRKIEENAMLSKQVDDSNRLYQGRIEELERKVKEYEDKFSHHQEINDVNLQKSKSLIDRLQEEKAMIEVKLQTLETDIKRYRSRAEQAEGSLLEVQSKLEGELEIANKIIVDKLPFIDTKNRDLNGLNLPTHDRKHQLRARELVSQTANHLTDMVQALSNFFTYSEQRSKIYPAECINEPMSAINIQYCKHLHDNVQYLRPFEQSFKVFLATLNEDTLTTLETATDLQIFSRKFRYCIEYFNKLLPYQLLSIEEECAVSSCTSTLESKNWDLHKSLKHLNKIFNKLESYVSLLASQSLKTCHHPKINHPRFFSLLCNVLKDLDHSVRDVSKHYNSKVSLEHQLPTASQKLKTTDECIVSSLISLVTCTSKLSSFLSGNIDFFSQSGGYRTRGSSIGNDPTIEGPRSNPATVQFRQKAANYITLLTVPCSDSVPHKVAVQNRRTLVSSAESKQGLSKQLTSFQQRVSRLEQDKEHYMLELQLLQIKYDNEIQKVKKIEKELLESKRRSDRSDSIEDNMTVVPTNTSTNHDSSVPSVQTSVIGKLDSTASPGTDVETRESLIKNHFTNRINELTLQLQDADSKSVSFHSEVRALHKQLQIAEKVKSRVEEELKETTQTLAQLKDEYHTTTKNYEGQLSMMSEHLAGLNEKLTQQKDEIDELRVQATSKSGKKSRR